MGYMHIDNLYKIPHEILALGEVYALEKIHGTSAHVAYSASAKHDDEVHPNLVDKGRLRFFSGGEKHENFIKLFDEEALLTKFASCVCDKITVYGEAYGGKCQGMSGTYGKDLKFIAFDVFVDGIWFDVPAAETVAKMLGFEFVAYNRVPSTVAALDAERDLPSRQAVRNGITEPKIAEGIVIRPVTEKTNRFGNRLIAKHKRAEFGETKTPREVDLVKAQAVADAQKVADEWVTEMRMAHVLDKLQVTDLKDTKKVIDAMGEDVRREAGDEIIWSKDVQTAIGTAAAKMYKKRVMSIA